MRVLIDGEPVDPDQAGVSVFDHGLLRGDGCFEALRAYDGVPFGIFPHLDRLESSAEKMELDLPPRGDLGAWIRQVAADGGDCVVRVICTRGGFDPYVAAPSRVVVLWERVPRVPETLRVLPLRAPWHPDGEPSELTGAKTISYAPNMAAGRAAHRSGYDDALLIGRSGSVLEGPTFSIGWIVEGALETPSLDLGVLASITRSVVIGAAEVMQLPVREGRFGVDRLDDADEVFAMSTVKEVRPIVNVGDRRFEPGEVTARLAEAYRRHVDDELAAHSGNPRKVRYR